jgi:hypothetical protein
MEESCVFIMEVERVLWGVMTVQWSTIYMFSSRFPGISNVVVSWSRGKCWAASRCFEFPSICWVQ